MYHVERFINQLMSSNCYLIVDEESRHCLCIDPGSEKSEREIAYIYQNGLTLDYVILTHEHTDHNWGVNALIESYPQAQIVCHKVCGEIIEETSSKFFRLYYDDECYSYKVSKTDITFSDNLFLLNWNNRNITIEYTPGHSMGSVCVVINKMIFTGDTIMPYKTYINKHDGSKELYQKSIAYINNKYFNKGYTIEPGHGEPFLFQ